MRGLATNAITVLLLLGVLLIGIYLAFVRAPTEIVIQQPAAPTAPTPEEMTVEVAQWDLLVVLADEEGLPVYEANVWLLYDKPANIYATPTANIYKRATDVNESHIFANVRTGKTYYILAAADGYYNGGTEYNVPKEIPKDMAELDQPLVAEVTLTHKGTIIGVQVPLAYRGSAADIAKLVYDEGADAYVTEYQWVVDNSGEVRYKKIRVDVDTANLGTATLDEVVITIGDKEFDISDIQTSKIVEFEEEQVIPKGGTLTVKLTVEGVDIENVSGTLFTVKLYDVQDGEYTATVEGPA